MAPPGDVGIGYSILGLRVKVKGLEGCGYMSPTMENQMENTMDNNMETSGLLGLGFPRMGPVLWEPMTRNPPYTSEQEG